jgi:predicted ATPase
MGIMFTQIELTNFQGFRGTHSVRLAPITLIFGPNASGKSSISRAIRLLKQSVGQAPDLAFNGPDVTLQALNSAIYGQGHLCCECEELGQIDPDDEKESEHECTFPRHFINEMGIGLTFSTPDQRVAPAYKRAKITVTKYLETYNNGRGDDAGDLRELAPRLQVRVETGEDAGSLEYIETTLPQSAGHPTPAASAGALVALTRNTHELFFPFTELLTVEEFKQDVLAGMRLQVGQLVLVNNMSSAHLAANALRAFAGLEEDEEDYGSPPYEYELNETQRISSLAGDLLASASQTLEHLLSCVRYIGPMREVPPRIELAKSSDEKVDYRKSDAGRWLSALTDGRYLPVSDVASLPDGLGTVLVRSNTIFDTFTGTSNSYADVGAGIGQVLPILESIFDDEGESSLSGTQLIEQPELHLHPKMQADLMDAFCAVVTREGSDRQLIIETHSESMLLRLQRKIRSGELSHSQATVVFVEPEPLSEMPGSSGWRRNIAYNIDFDIDGQLTETMPFSFAGLRLEELF